MLRRKDIKVGMKLKPKDDFLNARTYIVHKKWNGRIPNVEMEVYYTEEEEKAGSATILTFTLDEINKYFDFYPEECNFTLEGEIESTESVDYSGCLVHINNENNTDFCFLMKDFISYKFDSDYNFLIQVGGESYCILDRGTYLGLGRGVDDNHESEANVEDCFLGTMAGLIVNSILPGAYKFGPLEIDITPPQDFKKFNNSASCCKCNCGEQS